MIFLSYGILVVLVVVLSVYLSKYVDALDKKTNLSGAFIGGVLLAAVTSLPELFTSISAVLLVKPPQPELIQGNVFGSNIFNLTIFGGCVLFASYSYKQSSVSKSHATTVIFTIVLFIVCILGMYFPWTISAAFIKLNWASLAIFIIYIINIKLVNSDDSAENEGEDNVNLSVGQIVVRFILLSVALVFVSIMLTQVTDKLSDRLNLGKTVAGAIFLGVATSLPELTASINLVRLKNFNASIGNVTGSNLFNFIILCFGDLIYTKGGIYGKTLDSQIIIWCAVIASLLTLIALKTKNSRAVSSFLGGLIILTYVSSIVLAKYASSFDFIKDFFFFG